MDDDGPTVPNPYRPPLVEDDLPYPASALVEVLERVTGVSNGIADRAVKAVFDDGYARGQLHALRRLGLPDDHFERVAEQAERKAAAA